MQGKLKKRRRGRRHGFLKKMRSPNGKSVISRRRSKGRKRLAL